MSRHRADVRPRWGRIGASLVAGSVLLVALLATVGFLRVTDRSNGADHTYNAASGVAHGALQSTPTPSPVPTPATTPAPTPATEPMQSTAPRSAEADRVVAGRSSARRTDEADASLPVDSGSGRRAVFSIGRQRVWIIDSGDHVARTYLVSGSVTDNLDPGTYSVYSRSENAIGVDDSGTMKWFVRFAHGANAAIGFHDIPVKDGRPLQTAAQLGTPQSHGCIRQQESDALAMWDFAQLGTEVVVTA